MDRFWRMVVLVAVSLCVPSAALAEPMASHKPTDVFWQTPQRTWTILQRAPGIVAGLNPNAVANIQIVFDPNCPYSAKIYQYFKRHFPAAAVRWTPVAYMRRDSTALAAAILTSSAPAKSLDQDLGGYDFVTHRSGYRIPAGRAASTLGEKQQVLQKTWAAQWGGYTPMIFFRDSRGRVFQAQTDQQEVIDHVVKLAAHPLQPYRPTGLQEGR